MPYWRELRAGLITLAIAVALLDGCPLPAGGHDRKLTEYRLGRKGLAAVDAIDRARATLLRPLRPALDGARLYQRWKLFAGASRKRYRMWIDVHVAGGDWQTVYRVQDDDLDALAEPLGYRRVRGAWNPRTEGPRGAYPSFATWAAHELFARDPPLVQVRVRMERVLIGERGGYAGTGEFVYEQVRTREGPR